MSCNSRASSLRQVSQHAELPFHATAGRRTYGRVLGLSCMVVGVDGVGAWVRTTRPGIPRLLGSELDPTTRDSRGAAQRSSSTRRRRLASSRPPPKLPDGLNTTAE
ncbi:hypothetical protein IG631_07510 [Alternaria alternata]|nr:hypothetical protein IG631_07510 [Alternaria alternata]